MQIQTIYDILDLPAITGSLHALICVVGTFIFLGFPLAHHDGSGSELQRQCSDR
jgi:hypothetical protein